MSDEKDEREKPSSKKKLPKGKIFEFGEIKIKMIFIPDGQALRKLYQGKLRKTDLNKAVELYDKERSKYA